MAGTILVPLFNQTICPYSPTVSGLILLPGSFLIALLSRYSGKLTDRYGAKKVCFAGLAVALLGNLPFCLFSDQVGILPIALAYAVRCVGLTFLLTPSTALGMQDLSLEDKPYGMAVLNSIRQMAGAMGSTILVVVATVVSSAADIDLTGMHAAFWIMCGCAVLGMLLTQRMKRS